MINVIKNIFIIIFIMWLTLTISVFAHEWTHGVLAWFFGYKSSPFGIHYGGWSWQNLLYWREVDENVNFPGIALIGHSYQAGIIAITPPILINGGLTLISGYYFLRKHMLSPFMALFIFWMLLWNLGEFFSYVTLRSFSTHADVGSFDKYFNLSPWWVFSIGSYIAISAYHLTFKYILPKLYSHCGINTNRLKIFMFIVTIACLMLFTSIRPLGPNYNLLVHTMCYISILSIPFIIYAYWPIKSSSV